MTDEQLMQEVKNGQIDRLGQLFERYQAPMYGYFMRMTWDRPLSEDLTQLVFERILRYRTSFHVGRSFRAWMYQIARNVCIKHLEKSKRMQTSEVDWETMNWTSKNVDDCIVEKEKIKNLNWALAQLAEKQREVLLLTRYSGMKYAEVAELLDCSVSSVKVKVFRATEQLREHFFKIDAL
ncbi:MAG: RNA polymerase sigma factor [Bacteroidota bacterium]